MLKRIDHLEIITDQPERTIEFYCAVLGFKVRSRDRGKRTGQDLIVRRRVEMRDANC